MDKVAIQLFGPSAAGSTLITFLTSTSRPIYYLLSPLRNRTWQSTSKAIELDPNRRNVAPNVCCKLLHGTIGIVPIFDTQSD